MKYNAQISTLRSLKTDNKEKIHNKEKTVKQSPEVFYTKYVVKNFTKLTRKHLYLIKKGDFGAGIFL